MFPAWSPDGKKIAFYSNRDDLNIFDIYVMNIDGSNLRRITKAMNNELIWGGTFKWSPDGKKIVFPVGNQLNYDIYVIDSDGTGLRQLTNDSGKENNPVWSPDGKKIAYVSDAQIWLMDSDGSNKTKLTDREDNPDYPVWSPDGKRIAFQTLSGYDGEIFVINTDGSNCLQLTDTQEEEKSPQWSPDGNKLVFYSFSVVNEHVSSSSIYLINADGSGLKLLVQDAEDPVWLSDGKHIIFQPDLIGGVRNIYIINSDGTNYKCLTSINAEFYYSYQWCPR